MVRSSQFLSSLERDIRDAIFENVGTLTPFRVGAAVAQYLARESAPIFSAEGLISLPLYQVYRRLLIDGEGSKSSSGSTLDEPSALCITGPGIA